ncbi:hypothetical protein EB796_014409 [Bugula neritina]|uniref:Uncharacterized protein n=1 Tax=Bugula neritina TaxID=10212 RepID=A0A7J7JMJ5_BUGNE|nr:hypothetical protein EB796_014409 [Bugula neritina]
MSIPEIVAVHLIRRYNDTVSTVTAKPEPTMVTDSTNSYTPGHGHIVVTDSSTTADTTSAVENTKSNQDKKSVHESNESSSRSLIYNELTVIISSSVAAIAVLLLVLVIVILIVKRRKLKLQTDLQSESLFTSRRFSTVSQLSEVSVTGGHRLSHTP